MDYQDKIDRYLLGKFNSEEKEQFQLELENNADLMEELKKRQSIILGLEALGNEKMAERIKAVRQKMKEEKASAKPSIKNNKRTIIWILLAVLALTALLFFSWQYFANQQNNDTPEQLFAQAYQPYASSISARDATADINLIQADELYKAKNYQAAIPLLTSALKNQPTNSNIELALGNAYLSSNQIDYAITHFQNIMARKNPLYTDQARWYLALSYLKNDQIKAAKNLLQLLVADANADFHKEAKALLEKL